MLYILKQAVEMGMPLIGIRHIHSATGYFLFGTGMAAALRIVQ
jgi:hypothetical protein